MDYTPSTNTDPAKAILGEKSSGVLALQQALNAKNAGLPGYTPLKEDSLYGPKTQAATAFKPQSQLVVTSGPARAQFNKNAMDLNGALEKYAINSSSKTDTTGTDDASLMATDPIIAKINSLSSSQDVATKGLISSIQSSYQNQINKSNKDYENYKAGLQLLGIQHNEAQFTPDLLAGHIQQAANDHLQKIQTLTAEENKALLDAKNAKDDRDFKTLDKIMTRLKDIRTAKTDSIKSLYDAINSEQKISGDVAHNIYDIFETLDAGAQEGFIQAVAQKFNLPLATLTTTLADEKSKRNVADVKQKTAEINLKKKQGGGGGGTGTITQAMVNQGMQILKTGKDANGVVIGNPTGSDGYADPTVITKLFNDWPGTTAQFISKYGKSINPKAGKLVPAAIAPKKSSSRGS